MALMYTNDSARKMKEIGGYFGTEHTTGEAHSIFHSDGIFVNTGSNAFSLILQSLEDVKRVYLPIYVCYCLPETLDKLHIKHIAYHINFNFEIESPPELQDGDYIIVINYFGIKDDYIKALSNRYGRNMIVDNVQAYFSARIPGINTFYSIRKFFGIPDGGIAYTKQPRYDIIKPAISTIYNSHQILRDLSGAEAGFEEFHHNERLLQKQPLSYITEHSMQMLRETPYSKIKEQRILNFNYLHSALASSNKINLSYVQDYVYPMVYPYFTKDRSLRKRLIKNKVYIPRYWPELLETCNKSSVEYLLAQNLLPLPIDQRYNEEDMQYIIEIIQS